MIYLDHNATTPLAPEVLEAMGPFLTTQFGNPSSYYQLGRQARQAVEEARASVAESLGARAATPIWTVKLWHLSLSGPGWSLASLP